MANGPLNLTNLTNLTNLIAVRKGREGREEAGQSHGCANATGRWGTWPLEGLNSNMGEGVGEQADCQCGAKQCGRTLM